MKHLFLLTLFLLLLSTACENMLPEHDDPPNPTSFTKEERDKNGVVREKIPVKNGMREGLAFFFDEHGNVIRTVNYKDDVKHGEETLFDDGNPVQKNIYDQGELGVEHFYRDGYIHHSIAYFIGEKNVAGNVYYNAAGDIVLEHGASTYLELWQTGDELQVTYPYEKDAGIRIKEVTIEVRNGFEGNPKEILRKAQLTLNGGNEVRFRLRPTDYVHGKVGLKVKFVEERTVNGKTVASVVPRYIQLDKDEFPNPLGMDGIRRTW